MTAKTKLMKPNFTNPHVHLQEYNSFMHYFDVRTYLIHIFHLDLLIQQLIITKAYILEYFEWVYIALFEICLDSKIVLRTKIYHIKIVLMFIDILD